MDRPFTIQSSGPNILTSFSFHSTFEDAFDSFNKRVPELIEENEFCFIVIIEHIDNSIIGSHKIRYSSTIFPVK